MAFDVKAEVERLKKFRSLRKKPRYSRSKLDRYKYELLALNEEGATATDLQFWLKQKRVTVALSTVTRWLTKHG